METALHLLAPTSTRLSARSKHHSASTAFQTASVFSERKISRARSDGPGLHSPHWKCGRSFIFQSPPHLQPNFLKESATSTNHDSGRFQPCRREITSTASPKPCQLYRLLDAFVTVVSGGVTVRPRA